MTFIEDSQPLLVARIKTEDPDIRSIVIAEQFINLLKTDKTWTDSYGLTWTYEHPDLIKCAGNVWRIHWNEPVNFNGGRTSYTAKWPD